MSKILEALNSYEGENIWQDVIYGAMDSEATGARWSDEDSNHFIGEDGVHYEHTTGSMSESGAIYGAPTWWTVPQWRIADDDAPGE